MRMWPWLSRVRTAERVGEGSSPRTSSSPVSNKAKVLDVLTPSASSISVASTSRTPPFRVRRPSAVAAVGRLARALGAEVEQAVPLVAKLGEGEAAPVADLRVVNAELMAVIAKRERVGQVVRQRLEPAEMRRPLLVGQVQPDAALPSGD